MYLKRLDIQGFKSFPARTTFELGPGVTAVIGPNGSGKSNVADAVRWVLGEQNPRAMRLRKLEDALFAGGHKRPPSGFAEVSMWLDNADGWLPLDFAEVVVTRRLHRSGDSDYLINRQRVRLRDINELFLKGRLGQNSYAIMGQGLVDQVLSLKPEERRALIEEAAEIRRYRLRIEEAQDRLAATQENLEKVDLLVAEIAPRLSQLERQARRAREHEQLSRELAEVLHTWYGYRWRAGEEALVAARAAYDQRNAAFAAAQADLDQLDQRLTTVRDRLAEQRRAEQAAQERRRHLDDALREARQRLRMEEERTVFVRRRLEELESEIQALETERVELQLTDAGGHDGPAEGDLAAMRAALGEQVAAAAAFDDTQTQKQRALTQAEYDLRRRQGELREVAERLERVEQELAQLDSAGPAAQERRGVLLGRLAEIGRGCLARLRAVYAAEDEAAAADAQREEALRQLDLAREEAAALERAVTSLGAVAAEQTRRYELLQRMRDEHRGVDGAVHALLASAEKSGRPAIDGLLGELLRVPRGMEVAMEAALSEYISALIVPGQRDAYAALRTLYERPSGRATVFPLDSLRPVHALNLSNERGVVGVASRFVKCDPRYRDLVDTLLGRFIIVEDVETGQALLRRGLGTVVTLDGIVMRPNGSYTGGRAAAEGGRFALDREMAEIPSVIERALAEQEQRETELAAARRRLEGWRARVEEWGAGAEMARRALARARDALINERGAIAPVRLDVRYLREATEAAATHVKGLRVERDALAARQAELRRQEEAARARATTARQEAGEASARRDELQRIVSDLRGTLAATEREQQALAAMRESRRAARARLDERITTRGREAEGRRREIAQVEADCATLRNDIDEAAAERQRAETEDAPTRDRARSLAQELEELEPLAAARRRTLADIERACLNAEADVHRRAQEMERLRDEVTAEGIEIDLPPDPSPETGGAPATVAAARLSSEVNAPLPLKGEGVGGKELSVDAAALQERIRAIRTRIRAFGPINAQAAEDYQENKERHDFLVAQLADLRGAEAGLKEALDELRRLVRERFRESFQRIGADFQEYFKAFFGGGTARLVLTEPEDYGESGVDIIARPPGKRLQSLSLLSGGERSMTAVALLFALLQSNPAPFCVLDEVDAALDESNVGRFGDALKGLAARTQFIVVTHNRVTIQSADTIYGVSMGPDGASSILSLRLADVPE